MEGSGPPPVVDMKRHLRLYPPQKPWIEFNMMNLSVFLVFVTFLGLWMRAVDIRKQRDPTRRQASEPAPSALPG